MRRLSLGDATGGSAPRPTGRAGVAPTPRRLASLVDPGLHVIGRADDVIITGGENVHPAEIESVLAATPGVRAALAYGVADARWGQLVAAAIVADRGFELAPARAYWRAHLPSHARPRRLAVVTALPRLASGKPDRRAAAALPAVSLDEP
jgi:o-succinylbenzoate---CoA ligase